MTYCHKYRQNTTTQNIQAKKIDTNRASKKKNKGTVYYNMYSDMESLAKPKFKVGDKIRISKYKRKTFERGYTPNWTEEVFIIDKMQYTNPIAYKTKHLSDKGIKGSFYTEELSKATQDVFRGYEMFSDEVIRRDCKKKQALVKRKWSSDDFNSWISIKDLVNL